MSHSIKWLDTTDVIWLDTVDCIWKDLELLSASLEQEDFNDLVFDNVASVTPADATILKTGYVFVGSTGTVKVRLVQNKVDIIFNVLTAGSWIKLRIDKVYSTNTAATDIVLAN